MKIIAIGRNYPPSNASTPFVKDERPCIFCKPDTALLRNNNPFYLPDFCQRVDYELELAVRINRLGKNIETRFASRYYAEVGLAIDFTARDLQNTLAAQGQPWEISKAFDYSAPISNFIPLEQLGGQVQNLHFVLNKNEQTVQSGHTADMLFSVDEMIAYVSQFFMLKTGDILLTGTPPGSGPVAIGDHLQAYLENQLLLDFYVK